MDKLVTMKEVRKALKGAKGARLYSNGDLEIYRCDTVKAPYAKESTDVRTRIYVRDYMKPIYGTHWGEYCQDIDPNSRPALAVCFRDSAAPLLVGEVEHVGLYLQNNSNNMKKLGLDTRSVYIQYKNAGTMEFSYISTAGQPELLDNVTSAAVSIRFNRETREERERDCDVVWEMAKEEK